uniref:Uncharacterized protein n=1 Tax=Anopheles melas TaxID=34690 RepID=A0A182UA63_9DIPT
MCQHMLTFNGAANGFNNSQDVTFLFWRMVECFTTVLAVLGAAEMATFSIFGLVFCALKPLNRHRSGYTRVGYRIAQTPVDPLPMCRMSVAHGRAYWFHVTDPGNVTMTRTWIVYSSSCAVQSVNLTTFSLHLG